jgi:hypothetical protein
MSRNQISKVLVLASLVFAPMIASADPPTGDLPTDAARSSAEHAERSAGARVQYYAQLTTIAERDVVTAQITIDLAQKQRELAIRKGDDDAATYWEKRRQDATSDQRNARQRADRARSERDRARGDFGESAAEMRKPRNLG